MRFSFVAVSGARGTSGRVSAAFTVDARLAPLRKAFASRLVALLTPPSRRHLLPHPIAERFEKLRFAHPPYKNSHRRSPLSSPTRVAATRRLCGVERGALPVKSARHLPSTPGSLRCAKPPRRGYTARCDRALTPYKQTHSSTSTPDKNPPAPIAAHRPFRHTTPSALSKTPGRPSPRRWSLRGRGQSGSRWR